MLRWFLQCVSVCALVLSANAAAADIVLRPSNASVVRGNWAVTSDSTAAGGRYLGSADHGWSNTGAALASPPDYFEMTFSADAGRPYHVWFRLRAAGNSKWNDSVWVQYSDATTTSGAAVYRIGSTSALDVNLERCSGCGPSGWGWQDGAYWLTQSTTVQFANSGSHTIRVQTREDGVQIDQIVLSDSAYRYTAPGSLINDSTIVPTSGGTSGGSSTPGPYSGTPVSLPGRVEAENFDNGPDGTAYHDNTAGNQGATYRQTNADIQGCSAGGYNLGWLDAGEWMNYAVNVGAAGSYTVRLRVAAPSGGSLQVGFNNASHVWQSVSIPATGGWQNWTTVNLPVTLGAGQQLMTLYVNRAGFNLDYVEVVAGTVSQPAPTPAPPSGSPVSAVTWNIKVGSDARSQMTRLMNLSPRPQIVVLQEAFRSQYNTYLDELRSRTGQNWQGAFQNHCPPGAWNGSSCSSSEEEGVAVFTSFQVAGSSTAMLPYSDQWHSARALVRVAAVINGVTVQIIGTHLQSVASSRYSSMAFIKSYASNYPAPRIVAGDFNADPDQITTTAGMSPAFVDTWSQVGSGRGLTCNTPSPTMKLDYWFTCSCNRARATSTRVVTETGTASDHYPVLTTFSIQ